MEVGNRTIRVDGEANVSRPSAPYFVFSGSIRSWRPPHENDPLTEQDRQKILRAIRDYFDEKEMAYIVDPTDDEYHSS